MRQKDIITYMDNRSLLVINDKGKMKQLFAPFRVQVIQPYHSLLRYTMVYVEEIKFSRKYILLYRILDQWIPYYHFLLLVPY